MHPGHFLDEIDGAFKIETIARHLPQASGLLQSQGRENAVDRGVRNLRTDHPAAIVIVEGDRLRSLPRTTGNDQILVGLAAGQFENQSNGELRDPCDLERIDTTFKAIARIGVKTEATSEPLPRRASATASSMSS